MRKENGNQRHALDEDSKRYAMETTLSGGADTSELDEGISTWGSEVTRLQEQIRALQQQNDDLLAQISRASVEEAAALRAQYNANRNEISRLEAEKSRSQAELNKYLNARQELIDDYADERDGTYRIPAVMHEIETAYHIIWTDAGSWQGWSFVRHGNVPNISGEVEFRADLSKERGESHFLGIPGTCRDDRRGGADDGICRGLALCRSVAAGHLQCDSHLYQVAGWRGRFYQGRTDDVRSHHVPDRRNYCASGILRLPIRQFRILAVRLGYS